MGYGQVVHTLHPLHQGVNVVNHGAKKDGELPTTMCSGAGLPGTGHHLGEVTQGEQEQKCLGSARGEGSKGYESLLEREAGRLISWKHHV